MPGREARRYPLINLYEDRDTLYVEALAPGVDPASFDLTVADNKLTITGEKRRLPDDVKPEALHRSERSTGRFTRTVDLPFEVDAHQVNANYQHGLLLVMLPKAEKARPKQISVQVA